MLNEAEVYYYVTLLRSVISYVTLRLILLASFGHSLMLTCLMW